MDERRRLTRRQVATIAVAIALVVASGWFAWEVLRPRTIREVLEAAQWTPGASVEVEGTITGISRVNTSYGAEVYLKLDNYPACFGHIRGDPNATYRIGDRFRTTLHFATYEFNGDPAVGAPELVCPFHTLPWAIGIVWTSVSLIAGFLLVYGGTDANGWSRYEIVTGQRDTYRPEVLRVTLRRSPPLAQQGAINSPAAWVEIMSVQYVLVTGLFFAAPVADMMTSLAAGTSLNRTLRFVDSNGDGLAGDGDRVDVKLPATAGGTAYDTYMLQVGEVNGVFGAYAYAGHYLLHGPRGPYEIEPALPVRELAQLRHIGDQIGARVTSTVEVGEVRLGSPAPTSLLEFTLRVNGSAEAGSLSDLPRVFSDGTSLSFTDGNRVGLLDPGDRFIVGNLGNRSFVQLWVGEANGTVASGDWIAGYGHVVVGRPADFTLARNGLDRADVGSPYWHPELAMNRTPRATLQENNIPVLADVPLRNGTVGAFANGTLAFTDADGDGTLSPGDFFAVAGSPTARYELEVSLLFGSITRTVVLAP